MMPSEGGDEYFLVSELNFKSPLTSANGFHVGNVSLLHHLNIYVRLKHLRKIKGVNKPSQIKHEVFRFDLFLLELNLLSRRFHFI